VTDRNTNIVIDA